MTTAESAQSQSEHNEADTTTELIRLFREQFPVEVTRIVEPDFNSVAVTYSNGTTEYRKLK